MEQANIEELHRILRDAIRASGGSPNESQIQSLAGRAEEIILDKDFRIPEVEKLLGVSKRMLAYYMAKGVIHCVRRPASGRKPRTMIPCSAVLQYLRRHRLK